MWHSDSALGSLFNETVASVGSKKIDRDRDHYKQNVDAYQRHAKNPVRLPIEEPQHKDLCESDKSKSGAQVTVNNSPTADQDLQPKATPRPLTPRKRSSAENPPPYNLTPSTRTPKTILALTPKRNPKPEKDPSPSPRSRRTRP
jgi:hypothetical protein